MSWISLRRFMFVAVFATVAMFASYHYWSVTADAPQPFGWPVVYHQQGCYTKPIDGPATCVNTFHFGSFFVDLLIYAATGTALSFPFVQRRTWTRPRATPVSV